MKSRIIATIIKECYIPPRADLFRLDHLLPLLQSSSIQTDLDGFIDLEDYVDDGVLY